MDQPQEAKAKLAGVYAVELLYEHKPHLRKEELLAALRRRCPGIAPLSEKQGESLFAFVHPEHLVRYKDSRVPAQCLIASSKEPFDPATLGPAVEQSWSWAEADDAVAGCTASLLLTDFLARGLPYHDRLRLFACALAGALDAVPCRAIHWKPTQQIVNPQEFLAAMDRTEVQPIQLPGSLNVRFYRVDSYANRPGELTDDMLADTLGLGELGLPDLQCHFRHMNPDDVVRVLYNTAIYIYESGPVIESGHTITGIRADDQWVCHYEEALLPPERVVLGVNPGPPYAAGRR